MKSYQETETPADTIPALGSKGVGPETIKKRPKYSLYTFSKSLNLIRVRLL